MLEIDHVAAAVTDVEEPIAGLERAGAEHVWTMDSEEWGYETAYCLAGEDMFTLVAPTREDSFIADYLEARGPGFHHIGVSVDDLEAVVDAVTAMDAEVIMADRIPGTRREATVHPGSWYGLQMQFIEWDDEVGSSARDHIEAMRAAKTGADG